MNRTFALSGLLMTSLTWTAVASAEPVVDGLVLGVERIFGFTAATLSEEEGGDTSDVSATGFSLGASRGSLSTASYSNPRVAVDFILPMGLSFGGAFGVATQSIEQETGVLGTQVEWNSTALIFAPRVGYMLGFNEHFGVWPRAGFTYLSYSTELGDSESSSSLSAMTFEAPLVLMPNKFFGFTATPALDLGVGGSQENSGPGADPDISMTEFSFTLGLFVAF